MPCSTLVSVVFLLLTWLSAQGGRSLVVCRQEGSFICWLSLLVTSAEAGPRTSDGFAETGFAWQIYTFAVLVLLALIPAFVQAVFDACV